MYKKKHYLQNDRSTGSTERQLRSTHFCSSATHHELDWQGPHKAQNASLGIIISAYCAGKIIHTSDENETYRTRWFTKNRVLWYHPSEVATFLDLDIQDNED